MNPSPESSSIQTKKKREDLQCWRALAIIAVLLFHVWPETFPNGYLGVDIFFVLSGFLMATIVHEKQRINKDTTIDFYYRRIKRIAPIYLIFMVATVFWISHVLWKEDFKNFLKDAFWASGFLTNIQDFLEKKDYFDMKPPGWTPEDDIQAAHYLMGEDAFKNPDCINNEKSYTNITLRGYLRFCETRNPRSTKKLSALILGNSHANSAGPIIHRNKVFDKVITVSGASCPFPAKGGRGFCPDVMNIGIEVLEQLKPDVTFLLFAYLDRMLWRSSRPVEEDPKFHILNRTITEFSKYTKAIIINELDVRFSYGATKVFLRRKKMGPNIKSLRQKRNLSGERAIRRCLHLLLKYCPICVLVRPHDAFCDDRYCDPIDKEYNLPMFIDHGHIQALGRLRYKPFIDKAISQAIDIINKNPRKNKN